MTAELQTQVGIVGAGPAGMAAAIELAKAGISCVVLDEGQRPGGQIFRQVPEGFAHVDHSLEPPSHLHGEALIHGLSQASVQVVQGATVWDAAHGGLWFEHDGVSKVLRAERILLAPGAYDRAQPFPGWTLPGVMTAGAAQVMVRGHQVAPGTRALVAGSGPLLLPTVTSLLSAGVEVVAALEASSRWQQLRALKGVLTNAARRREATFYLKALVRHGIRLRTGWTVFAAHGTDQVERVTIGRVDRDGRPRRARATRDLDVDVVCAGFGLVPSIELGQLLGCSTCFERVRGGWTLVVDHRMKTTVDGVWAAGEIVGVGGAEVATAEGRLAGLAIAETLGVSGQTAALRSAQAERQRERRAADAMLAAFAPLPGLADLATDDTIVCRCEDVTKGHLLATARVHGGSVRATKMGCRAGMGPCQGRICGAAVHGMLDASGDLPCPTAQVPAKPVPIRTIVDAPPPSVSG